MKKSVCFAGVVVLAALIQPVQAVTMRPEVDSKPMLYSSLNRNTTTAAVDLARNVSDARNAVVGAPMLSALVSTVSHGQSTTIVSQFGYTPEPLNNHNKKNPRQIIAPNPSPSDPHATVPDGGATASLLGIGLLGTVLMKRMLGLRDSWINGRSGCGFKCICLLEEEG